MKIHTTLFAFALVSLIAYNVAEQTDVLVITPLHRELFLTVGDSVQLNCTFRSSSIVSNTTKVEWQKPSTKGVKDYKSLTTSQSKSTLTSGLQIDSLLPENFGDYTCKLTGSQKNQESKITLIQVVETKKEANFTYKDKDKSVILGCSINSTSTLKMEWLQNITLVKELKDADRFVVSKENHTLEIKNPMRADANKYIARFTLENTEEPYDCVVNFSAAPLVLDFDKSKNLIEGDKLELHCRALGYPPEPVTWFKDGKVLNVSQSNSRIHLSPLKGFPNAHLVIKDAEFSDAGDYMCEVKSELFNETTSKTITVRVKDKLAALWPFLGIVGEVIVLCAIIFFYEKRRNKQAEAEGSSAPEADGATTDQKEGLRHRNTQQSNPTA